MQLRQVEYRKCERCNKSMPLAHCKVSGKPESVKYIYRKHSNKICMVCIRAEIAKITNQASRVKSSELKAKKLSRLNELGDMLE